MKKKLNAPELKKLEKFCHNLDYGALFLFKSKITKHCSPKLFYPLQEELVCNNLQEVTRFFQQIEKHLKKGHYVAGYFSYELGYAWHKQKPKNKLSNTPLAWLGVFDKPSLIALQQINKLITSKTRGLFPDYWLKKLSPGINWLKYLKALQAIKKHISQGDTYQVNYTFPLKTQVIGNPITLFWDMYQQQPVNYAALLRNKQQNILSLSPELFFERSQQKIVMCPMKGTAARITNQAQDEKVFHQLAKSVKNRAENLMIVDLLRNDLGRICQTGKIKVKKLFQIEKYKTIYQMISTLNGELNLAVKWEEIFRSIFPCGSVTGAPKINTMQLISNLEYYARGIYTGALGYITPEHQAIFNVPIRTLINNSRDKSAYFNIGSGIVADSKTRAEWQESYCKASFLNNLLGDYELIETMRWEPKIGYQDLALHLKRLAKSAKFFSIKFDTQTIKKKLLSQAKSWSLLRARRVRLTLNQAGRFNINSKLIPNKSKEGQLKVSLSRIKMSASNIFLKHKTTNRRIYNSEYLKAQAQGLVDVLFTNQAGFLTEGAITNLFIEKSGQLLTPPIAAGLLPGITRTKLLKSKQAIESNIRVRDLQTAGQIWLSNSVKGLFKVQLINN